MANPMKAMMLGGSPEKGPKMSNQMKSMVFGGVPVGIVAFLAIYVLVAAASLGVDDFLKLVDGLTPLVIPATSCEVIQGSS